MAQCHRSDGMHKKAWVRRSDARKAARASAAYSVGRMEPYRCGECGLYHIGHGEKR